VVRGGRSGRRRAARGRVRGAVPSWWPLWAVAAGAVLACVVWAHPEPLPGELRYVRALQRLDEPIPTLAGAVWSATGTEQALVVAGVAAVALLWRRGARGAVAVAGAAGIAAATMLAVQPGLKDAVDRPRPAPGVVDVRAATESESFPSGHAMSTTTVCGAAAAVLWRRRRALAIAGALPIVLTVFASAVQGVHWPTDAIAGALFGASAGWLIARCLHPTG
jgi:membrane-associated phospholipid phosphatase